MSRQIPLDELNKKIDDKIHEWRGTDGAEALEDLKHEINEPRTIQDVSENLQQTFNVEETKKIINKDGLQ